VSAAEQLRTRSFSWEDPAATAAAGLSRAGIDYLREIVDGELPPPPFAQLLGFSLVEVESGRAVFAMKPAEWMYNSLGSVHGGIAATLLDSCMGCAVHSTLEAGDHTVIVGQVAALEVLGDVEPLIYYRSGYRRVD